MTYLTHVTRPVKCGLLIIPTLSTLGGGNEKQDFSANGFSSKQYDSGMAVGVALIYYTESSPDHNTKGSLTTVVPPNTGLLGGGGGGGGGGGATTGK